MLTILPEWLSNFFIVVGIIATICFALFMFLVLTSKESKEVDIED